MRDRTTVHGMEADQALWFTLAAENAVAMHWPNGAPRGLIQPMADLREAAAKFAALSGLVGALLLGNEVEGVTGDFCEIETDSDDDGEEDEGAEE